MSTNQNNRHTITALVQDKPGVLNRLSSMFRRRGFNISSLAVGKSEDESLSRMTFVVDGNDKVVEQVTKHLNKLIDVIKVSDISQENIVLQTMCLEKFYWKCSFGTFFTFFVIIKFFSRSFLLDLFKFSIDLC